eukprot:4568973-Pyramimonas_sp.AAC.1
MGSRPLVERVFACLSKKSWIILADLERVVQSVGRPFVICGDFQLPPVELQGSLWVEAIDGICLFPSAATCTNASVSAGRIIDYFVVSQSLAHNASLEI